MLDALRNHPVNGVLVPAFEAAGLPLFLVGGPVRDALSGSADFSDLDYTTSARPEDTLAVVSSLGPTWVIGMEFGTVCVQIGDMKVEITTFRTEAYEEGSRKPKVVFGETIADDLARRDLTVNAMALCLVSDGAYAPGDLVDLFGGRADLATGVLRTPDDPFRTIDEDPLRALRAVRFSVKRGMAVAPELAAAISALSDRLAIVSAERKTEELRKVLSAGSSATRAALSLSRELGVDVHLFGGLASGGDLALDLLAGFEGDELDQLAVLVHAAEVAGDDAAGSMRQMKLSNEEIRPALHASRLARTLVSGEPDRVGARRLVRTSTDEQLDRAARVALAASGGSAPDLVVLVDDVRSTEPEVRLPLPVDGNDLLALGLKGPAVGRMVARVTDEFLANPHLTRAEALALARG